MLDFPKDYFQREIRCGFVVGEVMKRAWAAQLEMLAGIMRVSEKHGLTCYVYWGSLLGTIRHQGFIPWDDDLDVAFVGEDYVKFLEVAAKELPPEYDIRNAYTMSDWGEAFTRINNNRDMDISAEYMEKNHGFPLIVGIDVFPLYYIPRDEEFAGQQKLLLRQIFEAIGTVLYQEELTEGVAAGVTDMSLLEHVIRDLGERLAQLQQLTGYAFQEEPSIKTQLCRLFDGIARMCQEDESDAVTHFWQHVRNDYAVDKILFDKTLKMPFENLMVNVPVGYDEILQKTFKNYMTPRRYKSHDYPFFKEEVRVLGEQLELLDLQYKQGVENINVQIAPDSAGVSIPAGRAKGYLPSGWWEKIYPLVENGQRGRRKVLLFYTSISAILNNSENVMAKLKYVKDIVKNNSDIVLWWFPGGVDAEYFPFVQVQIENLLQEYKVFVEEFQTEDLGIYDTSGDLSRAIAFCDAFYGDEGVVADCVQKTGKPVMYQNYAIV